MARIFCPMANGRTTHAPSTNSHSGMRSKMYLQQKKRARQETCARNFEIGMPTGRNSSTRTSLGTPMYPDPESGGRQFCLLEIYSMRKTHFRIVLGEEMLNPGAVRELLEHAVRSGKWIS